MFKYRTQVGTKAHAKQIIAQKKRGQKINFKKSDKEKRKRRRRDQLKTHEQ